MGTLHESSLSYSTAKAWVADLRPKTATTTEIGEKVYRVVLNDRRLKLIEIADIAGISTERTC